MKYLQETLSLSTVAPLQIIDLSEPVRAFVQSSGLQNGLLTIFSTHTTAYISINEQEALLEKDMLAFLKRQVPRDGDYQHNLKPADGRDNAHAHLLGLSMNASESIPLYAGKLALGTWQSVFFIELDGPRPARQVILHLMGD